MTLPPPYSVLKLELADFLSDQQLIDDPYLCLAYGSDASFYRLIPKLVLKLRSVDELKRTLFLCAKHRTPYTFRAAGTSLSGQAISDSVLVTLTDDWCGHQVLEDGHKIRLQPGVIGADANRYLSPYSRKIGPDPASINACKVGGIVANNSSGMCCGTSQNSYQTLASMTILFADGTLLDTGNQDSIDAFSLARPDLMHGIQCLCEKTAANPELTRKIRHKYRLKNTTGYSLNALIDFEDPIKVLEHLMVGSEGTLGFIVDVTYSTVEDPQHKASSLVVFDTIEAASLAVTALSRMDVDAVELMDGRALSSIKDQPDTPEFIRSLDLDATALLIECSAATPEQLSETTKLIEAGLADLRVIARQEFTRDQHIVDSLWNIRKGLFPAVGAVRTTGTSVIIEDVAFPVDNLAQGVRELQQLLSRYHYDEAIIFGHALDGNLHFVFTQGFEKQSEIERYQDFMNDVTELVAVKYQGSLKAEHGTGRNMAPFVELEWGNDAYSLMQEIKQLFDPHNLINPGVIINSDQQAHLTHLKPLPKTDSNVDPCIECGFCEPVCPSRTLSLSPRQRIILHREQRHQEAQGKADPALTELYQYQGIETCAATGLCASRCPVGINTGDLIHDLRQQQARPSRLAKWSADHFATSSTIVRWALKGNQVTNRLLGSDTTPKLTTRLHQRSSTLPVAPDTLPGPNFNSLPDNAQSATTSNESSNSERVVVYLPSCISRTTQSGTRPLSSVMMSLLSKAGFRVVIPDNCEDLCCGKPYDSKGQADLAMQKSQQLELALLKASNQGDWPIVTDASPCALQGNKTLSPKLRLFESVHFVQTEVVPFLDLIPLDETVMLHITCSSKNLNQADSLMTLAQLCATRVVVPEHIECCGFAGDKGFFVPELNQHALHPLKDQVPEECQRGFSNSPTCEIGLSQHSGIPYQSLLYLVDEAAK